MHWTHHRDARRVFTPITVWLPVALLLWAAVPWVWARPRLLEPAEWRPLAREVGAWAKAQWTAIRTADRPMAAAGSWGVAQLRVLLGLGAPATPPTSTPPDIVATPPAPAG